MRSPQRLAAMMPAMRATERTSPLGPRPGLDGAEGGGGHDDEAFGDGAAAGGRFGGDITMRAAPRESRWERREAIAIASGASGDQTD